MAPPILIACLLLAATTWALPQHRLVHYSPPGQDTAAHWTIMPQDDPSDATDPSSTATFRRAGPNHETIDSEDDASEDQQNAMFRNSPPSANTPFRAAASPSRTLLTHHAFADNSPLFRGGLADYMHPLQRTILTGWLSEYFPKIFKKKTVPPVQANIPYGYPYPPPPQYSHAYNPYADHYPGAYPFPPQYPYHQNQIYGDRRPHSPPRATYPYIPPGVSSDDNRVPYPYPPPHRYNPHVHDYGMRPAAISEEPVDPYSMYPSLTEFIASPEEDDVEVEKETPKRKTEEKKEVVGKRPVKS